MSRPVQRFAARYEPVLLGLMMGALFYATDALMDAALFGEGSLTQQLLSPTSHEIAIRLLAFAVQMLFVLYTWRVFRNRGKLEGALAASRRETKAERARAEAILDAIDDRVSVQDREFRILYQNRAHREAVGAHFGEFCYQAYRGRVEVCDGCHLARSFAAGIPSHGEICDAAGGRFLDVCASPLRDGEGLVIAGIEVIRDVSDRKVAELEVARLNGELEQRAAELAAANAELTSFGYSLAHDLRSPLTQVNLAAQALAELGYRDGEESAYFLRAIGQAVDRMEELIRSLLVLSRVNPREPQRAPVDLGKLAAELADGLVWRSGRRVRLQVAPGLVAQGDPELLKLLLENLLDNAWKYTAREPEPRVEIGMLTDAEEPTFFVRDNGAGFDMAQAHRLFRVFQRLHGDDEFPGSGIGLATVQRIVIRHGGRIRAESAPGAGATFYFSLPAGPPGPSRPPLPAAAP